jgi:hypothetical protein
MQGDGHRTVAMWYAVRHMALTRVEEILAHSYSLRDMVLLKSPTTFGAVLALLEDIVWAVGIEQRMANLHISCHATSTSISPRAS